jgi:hypothetical protein
MCEPIYLIQFFLQNPFVASNINFSTHNFIILVSKDSRDCDHVNIGLAVRGGKYFL